MRHEVVMRRLRLLDLPIRDGNSYSIYTRAGRFNLLDLPIRDGNQSQRGRSSVTLTAFRPSYQGWKHGEVSIYATAEATF